MRTDASSSTSRHWGPTTSHARPPGARSGRRAATRRTCPACMRLAQSSAPTPASSSTSPSATPSARPSSSARGTTAVRVTSPGTRIRPSARTSWALACRCSPRQPNFPRPTPTTASAPNEPGRKLSNFFTPQVPQPPPPVRWPLTACLRVGLITGIAAVSRRARRAQVYDMPELFPKWKYQFWTD
ncbi:PREDICTED: mucin-6-like [Pygoscelis adeliae]|uniref:mucin-6-like n=1 Tax=Pygoscelis adeliae TaxID=9238 RepID=UPI0004F4F2DA|nr:PREDICTED: mucin-6-like [Pygoscelis adeliae]